MRGGQDERADRPPGRGVLDQKALLRGESQQAGGGGVPLRRGLADAHVLGCHEHPGLRQASDPIRRRATSRVPAVTTAHRRGGRSARAKAPGRTVIPAASAASSSSCRRSASATVCGEAPVNALPITLGRRPPVYVVAE